MRDVAVMRFKFEYSNGEMVKNESKFHHKERP